MEFYFITYSVLYILNLTTERCTRWNTYYFGVTVIVKCTRSRKMLYISNAFHLVSNYVHSCLKMVVYTKTCSIVECNKFLCCSVVLFFWFSFYGFVYGCMFCILLFNFVSYVFLLCLCILIDKYVLFCAFSNYPDGGFSMLFPQL